MKKLIVALCLLTSPALGQEAIVGEAMAIDGDTIVVTPESGKPIRVRLWGIDAPEMRSWPWGPHARGALDHMIDAYDNLVRCIPNGRSKNRVVAICKTQTATDNWFDLGRAMILQGRAVEWRSFTNGRYAVAEREAIKARRGVWRNF